MSSNLLLWTTICASTTPDMITPDNSIFEHDVIFHHAQRRSLVCGLSPEVHLSHSVILLQNSPLTLLAIHFKTVARKYTLLPSSSNTQIYSGRDVFLCVFSLVYVYILLLGSGFFIISKINQGGGVFSLSSPIQWHYAPLAV